MRNLFHVFRRSNKTNRNLCEIKILRCVLIHPIQWNWHRANSGCSPKSKWPWKVNVLNRFKTSMQPRQSNYRHSRKWTSRTDSESGRDDGEIVFETRGSNLRRINGKLSFTVLNIFYLNIHHIFLSHLAPECQAHLLYTADLLIFLFWLFLCPIDELLCMDFMENFWKNQIFK